ncbi:MAG: ATP-grasp domain-containing protein [Aliivibrio sp.]|uniref:arsenate reductase/protein-tyrosine-phosphatase family protein n=1 Tax=Aliivibrio sp. TaxID=1872443 RepID=UPI001A488B14|nr:ATP-grasp domain-containing protein [Aliivibrio sp.]
MSDTHKAHSKRVLVLGEDARSFLTVIRSLAESGYEVHAVCYDQQSPAFKSRYLTSLHSYNYQAYSQQQWLDCVLALIERYRFHLVIPCDERAIYPLWSQRNRIANSTKLAISNSLSLDILFDKWKTKQAAIECNVAVAKGSIHDLLTVNYQKIANGFGEQFVIKPLQSFNEDSLSSRQNVKIINSEKEYDIFTKSLSKNNSTFLIEEFFEGKGEGLSVFAVEGTIHAAFAHIRVAEPKQGGGSSYRKSIPLDPDLLIATEKLCQDTKLTGVAMFEYRRNEKSRRWILVEVNARFWGSLPLAVASGINFPKLYADYLCDGYLPKTPLLSYDEDHYARQLLADLYRIKGDAEYDNEHYSTRTSLINLIKNLMSFSRIFIGKETLDSFSWQDKQPFFRELKTISEQFSWALIKKVPLLITIKRNSVQKQLMKLFKLKTNRRVLFICYGNIMRSSFAEHYLSQKLIANGIASKDQIASYGFHKNENRQSPQNAQFAAKQLNVSLSEHRSKSLYQSDIEDSDILIYFDESHRLKLMSYYCTNHLFSAADLLDKRYSNECEISDPYNGSSDEVSVCYKKVINAVEQLLLIKKGAR